MHILITGANGLIGSAVMRRLAAEGHYVGVSSLRLTPDADWRPMLGGVEAVVHAAARVHRMRDTAPDPLAEFRSINVDGTLRLAEQAMGAGVKRFIFLSSIKVNGERTAPEHPFTAEDVPAPEDAYAHSKYEAELALQSLAKASAMEVVILRPPLVYGPGVKGNMASLLKLVTRGVPLPLGSLHNKRSFIALDNLVDVIVRCLNHPAAANQKFVVSDGCDLSTTELLQHMARAMNRPSRLLPCPPWLMRLLARLVGKPMSARRLCDSLQIDITKTKELLGWSPPVSVEEGMARMVKGIA